MKKFFAALFLTFLMTLGCNQSYYVDADVLAVNDHILQGQLIGNFLSSPDGWISDDNIKLSVSFDNPARKYPALLDLSINHAEAIYYKDSKQIKLILRTDWNRNCVHVFLYWDGREVATIYDRDYEG